MRDLHVGIFGISLTAAEKALKRPHNAVSIWQAAHTYRSHETLRHAARQRRRINDLDQTDAGEFDFAGESGCGWCHDRMSTSQISYRVSSALRIAESLQTGRQRAFELCLAWRQTLMAALPAAVILRYRHIPIATSATRFRLRGAS